MFDYVSLDEMKADSGNAQFFDDVAEGLKLSENQVLMLNHPIGY